MYGCVYLKGSQNSTHEQANFKPHCELFKDLIPLVKFLFFFFNKFIYLFLAALGLHCCVQAFSSCSEQGLLFVVVRGLLIVVASLVAEHGLQARGFSSCGARAQLLCSMWNLPRPGLEHVSPALAGRFLTTAPPGKSQVSLLSFAVFLN